MFPFFSHRVVLHSPLSRAMSRELKRRHHVFEFGAIALVFIHLAGYPPEFVYQTAVVDN